MDEITCPRCESGLIKAMEFEGAWKCQICHQAFVARLVRESLKPRTDFPKPKEEST